MKTVSREVLGVFDFGTRAGWQRFHEVAASKLEGEGARRIVVEDPTARQRTDRQNRYYFGVFCARTAAWMKRKWGYTVGVGVPHEMFKDALLRVPVVDEDGQQVLKPNGEPLIRTRSTTELNTREWNEFLDRCSELMLDLEPDGTLFAPEPSVYRERDRTTGKELVKA